MKLVLFGKNGQVGWELQRALAPLGELIALDSRSTDYCGDLLNPEGIRQTILSIKPDIIVNAAAYTAVDKAESDAETAHIVNSVTPGVMAEAAAACGAWLVHYSTDYVFPGGGNTPWQETDNAAPLNVYGQTKLEGEHRIARVCNKYLIFRTSWVYASRGNNFAKTMIRLGKQKEILAVINDQYGAPTSAELLADCTAYALMQARQKPDVAGIYHLAAAGETTWHEYAQYVLNSVEKHTELAVRTVNAVQTTAYPTPARRPNNSRMNCDKFQRTFELTLPHWTRGVGRMLDELFSITL
ncbi:dTDP-4-dehydrorhamnose reductase [Pantoea sp. FN0305]|uniref:dTDP-4-dehydrorhamnose reductase n=1 Tax=Pantoea sp. FN0305 TaxID=3418559 RepID=UPI003CF93D85